jgi:hypothetical protein
MAAGASTTAIVRHPMARSDGVVRTAGHHGAEAAALGVVRTAGHHGVEAPEASETSPPDPPPDPPRPAQPAEERPTAGPPSDEVSDRRDDPCSSAPRGAGPG